MKKIAIAEFADLADRKPRHALVGEVDLVIVRFDDDVRSSTVVACIAAP